MNKKNCLHSFVHKLFTIHCLLTISLLSPKITFIDFQANDINMRKRYLMSRKTIIAIIKLMFKRFVFTAY